MTRAWFHLLLLSAASLAAHSVASQLDLLWAKRLLAALVLLLALRKCDLILADYLDLREAPRWRKGLRGALGTTLILYYGLWLAGGV